MTSVPHDMLTAAQLAALEAEIAASVVVPIRVDSDPPVTGYVPGGWDMFHIGHLNILRRARGLCDHLIVGVASDEALFRAKGKYPVVPLTERMQVVAALGIVDQVVVDEGSKIEVFHRHHFDVLFKGDDWKNTPKGDQLIADMASIGVRVHFLGYTHSTSSTLLRKVVTAL